MANTSDYSRHYNESSFWSLIRRVGRQIPFARNVLAMYFCMVDPDTPVWVKGLIAGALGYFILPVDAIPDFIPIAGWTDDAGVVAAALGVIHMYIKEEHWEQADEVLGGI